MKNPKNNSNEKQWMPVWHALQKFEQVCKQHGVDLPYEKVAALILHQNQTVDIPRKCFRSHSCAPFQSKVNRTRPEDLPLYVDVLSGRHL